VVHRITIKVSSGPVKVNDIKKKEEQRQAEDYFNESLRKSGNYQILSQLELPFPSFLSFQRFMCLWASGSARMFSVRQWRIMNFSEALDSASRLLGGIFRLRRQATRS
jgi:hypothetical protein